MKRSKRLVVFHEPLKRYVRQLAEISVMTEKVAQI
jgi:hypothetical protein